jgi:hypothetical protein
MIESKPIRRKRGQTSSFDITFTTDNGESLPLDGTVELVVTREANPTATDTPIMTLAGVIQATPNIVRFTPSPTDADNVGAYYYEVKHTSAGGAVRPLLEGEFLMEETRAH